MASDDEGDKVTVTPLPPIRSKRRSTIECLFPPLQDDVLGAHSEPSITIGGEINAGSSLRLLGRPERLSRGISRNVTPLIPSPPSSALEWGEEEVNKWLHDMGMTDMITVFALHAINSGSILLQLTEEHLKEMEVDKIGHRILLTTRLNELRREAGILLPELGHIQVSEQLIGKYSPTPHDYPQRIILIRHAESQGNVDSSRYSYMPDNKLELTPNGRTQAHEAGLKLKELIGSESVAFYISPFIRSWQTFQEIRNFFPEEQVLFEREDPRIREQEWGNFQNPKDLPRMMLERRSIGAFFYRFPTGESGADVYDRVSMFLESLYRDMERGRCGQNAIIVSHGLFCRLFLTRFYHWKIEFFHRLWNFENCQFAVMSLQPEGHYKLTSQLSVDPPPTSTS